MALMLSALALVLLLIDKKEAEVLSIPDITLRWERKRDRSKSNQRCGIRHHV